MSPLKRLLSAISSTGPWNQRSDVEWSVDRLTCRRFSKQSDAINIWCYNSDCYCRAGCGRRCSGPPKRRRMLTHEPRHYTSVLSCASVHSVIVNDFLFRAITTHATPTSPAVPCSRRPVAVTATRAAPSAVNLQMRAAATEFQTSSSLLSSREVSSYSNFYSMIEFFCDKIYRLICSTILAGISTRWNLDLTLTLTLTLSHFIEYYRNSSNSILKLRLEDFVASPLLDQNKP